MVDITITYSGDLHTSATHGPSGVVIETDAPVDNQGRGECFSPTDLVATALGTCMLTYMGMAARRQGWDLAGTTVRVQKEMVADPLRRIGRITVTITLNRVYDDREMKILANSVTSCPVRLSISDMIEVPVHFHQGPAEG
ncbi:MAG: OsmC family peroxiredoxin [Chlorobi bacterium]|nr:MAG: OsmC family protein [Bacteroidota bacterium]KXK34393.1 MAG: OsmC-like protein [Chlorobi bacterium OLB6]MBE2265324.1 OsmC family protein [Flavobacteriales bacterium]MBL1160213.1 OsmC family peroxiredoxin [Chlorobiota bacterium]MBW7853351.1 OsmC family protein [Candidatus Kapabacteria bacterium]MCC6330398.1 OsmC family protein [Ignavibacteria bacterium]